MSNYRNALGTVLPEADAFGLAVATNIPRVLGALFGALTAEQRERVLLAQGWRLDQQDQAPRWEPRAQRHVPLRPLPAPAPAPELRQGDIEAAAKYAVGRGVTWGEKDMIRVAFLAGAKYGRENA